MNNLKNLIIGILSAVIVIAIGASVYTAFASPGANAPSNLNAGNGNGNGSGNARSANGTGTSVLDLPVSGLTAEEAAGLLFMREEEKLARDVYNTLYSLWGQPTFQNIAASEQKHMDEVKLLLDRYGLTDPALAPGQFTDSNLQALYDQLVAQGSISLAEALKVGAAIEEIDILDLQTRLAQTDNADIQLVYSNLMSGSVNHLQAFTSVYARQTGETYQPQYMTAEQYQAILAGTNGNGNRNGQVGNGNGNGGRRNGQVGNSNGNGGQRNGQAGAGTQANIASATTVHGVVKSYELTGMSLTLDDGTSLYVQLGNSRYSQSIGFAPAVGEGVTVYGFIGDQNLFNAISVTLDSSGQVYTFRTETGQPLWAGGNGRGNGGRH